MKIKQYENKSQLLIMLLAAGFFIGVVVENILVKNNMEEGLLFNEDQLQTLSEQTFETGKYWIYIVRERVILIFGLCMMGKLKNKSWYAGGVVFVLGNMLGMLLVKALLKSGMKGLILWIGCLFPHMFFYGMALVTALAYWSYYPIGKWSRSKTVFVIILLAIGMVMEIWINPRLMKMILFAV